MRIRKVDVDVERKITTGMIVSDEFLAGAVRIYQADLMSVPFARTVAGWCLGYGKRYGKAPGRHVQDIFEQYRRAGMDADQEQLIADFMAALSDEWEHAEAGKFNAQYALDQAAAYFEQRNQELLIDDLRALHMKGDVKAAEQVITGYRRVARPSAAGVEPLVDAALIERALNKDEGNVLFRLPGALGELVGPVVRGDFIGIMGHEKVGKTWRLQDLAVRALAAHCNVAYFDAGDSNEDEHAARLLMRVSRCSTHDVGRMLSPVLDCQHSQDDSCRKRERVSKFGVVEERRRDGKMVAVRLAFDDAAGYTPCTACVRTAPRDFKGAVWHEQIDVEQLSVARAVALGRAFSEHSRKRFKLSCHPNGTLSMGDAVAVLDAWEQEDGFVPDVCLFDYPDIMCADADVKEERQRHNSIWMAGRRLSQERHCAVFFCTQSDAASYDAVRLRAKNFSEDKRKFSHVTKFWTLQQSDSEKDDGIIRVGTMFYRHSRQSNRLVAVMQNLEIGQTYLGSFFV